MSDTSLLDWRDGQPVSRLYGDVFFSRASGIDETRHVFLEQNRLAERWRGLPPRAAFIIGETGFGTGLNFLCARQLWQECAPPDAWLHFFSVEKHPLSPEELKAALALWPQLGVQRDELLAQYSALPQGWHRFVFAEARITLTLAVGDVAETLPQLDVETDAWFLDGFAPARNPEMWSRTVLESVARHTKPGGSFATYTAAGEVRRILQAEGFEVERVSGHGAKREMLRGLLRTPPPKAQTQPWFARPAPTQARAALVIGGGIAGVCAAASLAERGWEIELLERRDTLAAEASGNAQGILYLRLSASATPLRELLVGGYGYSRRLLDALPLAPEDYSPCGLLQLNFNEAEAARQQALSQAGFPPDFLRPVERAEAETLAGIALPSGGLWFSQGGWAHPPAVCEALAAHPRIRLALHRRAIELRKSESGWQVLEDGEVIGEAPALILAGARDIAAFPQSAHLPFTVIRGQISHLPRTETSAALRAVVCGEAYVAPARNGLHTLGATHKFRDLGTDVRIAEHEENLAALENIAPALRAGVDAAQLQGRAALRSSTPDYLPMIGPLAGAAAFNLAYADLRKDATLPLQTPSPWLDGLYVSAAHGSRGLISAPLAGEILAAQLSGEPAPLPKHTMDALHPSRFLLRDLIRRKSAT